MPTAVIDLPAPVFEALTLRKGGDESGTFVASPPVGSRFVHSGTPIDVNPTTKPELALIVQTHGMCEFHVERPGPQGLRRLIENADSTLNFALNQKVQDCRVQVTGGRRLIVHREPPGRRVSVIACRENESDSPIIAAVLPD